MNDAVSAELFSAMEQAPLLEIIDQAVQRIPVAFLCPHPLNRPATDVKREQIDTLKMLIAQNGYDGNKPLTVRKKDDDKYEIIEGHHRWLAAQQAGLTELPCWVKEMTDEQAYMELVLCNTQSELHPLEEGKHAAESGMDLKAYAKSVGKGYQSLYYKTRAYSVYDVVNEHAAKDSWSQLAEIHAAPSRAQSAGTGIADHSRQADQHHGSGAVLRRRLASSPAYHGFILPTAIIHLVRLKGMIL